MDFGILNISMQLKLEEQGCLELHIFFRTTMNLEMLFSGRPLFFMVCINISTLFKSDQALKKGASEGPRRVASHVELQPPEASC